MENTEITQETLSEMKDEILTAMQLAMARERQAQETKLTELCDTLVRSNQESAALIQGAIFQLDKRIQSNAPQNTEVLPASVSASIEESNIFRLLKTFEEALDSAGDKLAVHNEEEIGKYIRLFSERFEAITDSMKEKLAGDFSDEIIKLGGTLEGYSLNMAEMNRASLSEVQAENNQELQKLAKLLSQLTQENLQFRENVSLSDKALTDSMDRLIENSGQLSDTLRSHISDGALQMESVMERQIDRMVAINADHEKENADEFRNAMEDYRQAFITANAEAMAQVQSDMLSRMEETQKQMSAMASTFNEYLKAAKLHEDKIFEETSQLTQIVKENSDKVTAIIKETVCNIDLSIQEMHGVIDDQHALMSEQMNSYTDTLNDSVEGALGEYNDKLSALTEKIIAVLDMIKKLECSVEANTQSYKETLLCVTERQKESHAMAKDDIKLLQEMMKKL